MGQTRKMVNMRIAETSGVDHPAHEHEGWIVMKSASAESVESLFGALDKPKEAPVADITKDAELTPEQKLEAAEARAVAAEAALAEATAAPAAETEPVTPAAPLVAEPAEALSDTGEDASLEKALAKMPEPIRAFLAKQKADLVEAQATINKERDQRLDSEAIAKSKGTFTAIAIDHTAVAPALRRVALLDADLAKAVETALSAADAQLSSGTKLTKEIGTPGAGEDGSATERINKAATALREADPTLSSSQAFVKALESDKDLYAAYTAEKAGK